MNSRTERVCGFAQSFKTARKVLIKPKVTWQEIALICDDLGRAIRAGGRGWLSLAGGDTTYTQDHFLKINEIEKLNAEDDFTSFSDLPEEIIFQILNKLIDLKTLCLCKLVSRRFYRIVLQVETISYSCFTDPFADPSYLASYWSAIESLMEFERVKSLCIQFPSSFDDHSLFKWMVNFKVKIDSLIFLSPNSVCLKKEFNANEIAHQEGEEDMAYNGYKIDMLEICISDMVNGINLLAHIIRLPMLEKVSITDSRKRGKVSVSDQEVAEARNWLSSPSDECMAEKLKYLGPFRMRGCYVPLLELPVSGYVMKGVMLYLLQWNDPADDTNVSFMKSDNDDAFEDKEETVYNEALMEIFKKHSHRIVWP